MEKLYTFNLTLDDARKIVEGLKHLPMGLVEGLVANMDKQFLAQNKPAEVEVKPSEPTQGTTTTTDVEKAKEVAKVKLPRKSRKVA